MAKDDNMPTKKEIIQLGTKLGAPYHLTRSCYNGREKACGVCDSCKLRLRGFAEAGIKDPIAYEKNYNYHLFFYLIYSQI